MQLESEVKILALAQKEIAELTRKLHENRERLAIVQQAANIGIFDWNIPRGTISWTKEAEALYGLASGSFGGSFAAWERCVHPEDLPEAREKVLESVATHNNLDIQFRVIWPSDGSIHWIYAKARTFYGSQDQPLRMIGVNIDITERKMYEEELHIKEEKLRLFADSDIIGLIFMTIHGEITYANDAFLQIIGYTREDFKQGLIRWTELTPPEWVPSDSQNIAESMQTGAPSLIEKQYIHKNGHVVDVLIGYRLFGEKREQGVAFVLDISERKHLERQKDEFIGVVSHELRTPVTSLKVFAQLMQKRFKRSGDEQNAELLSKMGLQINKLARLVEDLIDITKLGTNKLQLHETHFDLSLLVDEIVEEMQRTTERHTLLKESQTPQIVWGDRNRVGQVLTNLLSNAIKYSPQSDTIYIRMLADERWVKVDVQDTGLGIPLDQQDQIFQRFYRVEEQNLETIPGMGLGLYICEEMIKRQGGSMHFASTPGQGSTFGFSLPLAEEASKVAEKIERDHG